MKILWFTNTSSLYEKDSHGYNGGGWIASLEELMKKQSEIKLAISFLHKSNSKRVEREGVTYFPIKKVSGKKNPIKTILNNWLGKFDEINYDSTIKQIILEFQPDIIHVFGTEGIFTNVQNLTTIPVVIHLQGLINPCLNAYFPVNQSKLSFISDINYIIKNLIGTSPIFGMKRFEFQAKNECRALKTSRFVMGRTNWDKLVSKIINPKLEYFHVDEVLRPIFYLTQGKNNEVHGHTKVKLLSTISPTIYKGIDVVLKTAKILKETNRLDFEWELIGIENNDKLFKHFEKTEKIVHHEVNIKCLGKLTADEIVIKMKEATIFIHPSYIDNSPNSVCEAQMLGLPVITCNVGGVSSLIEDNVSGILVPSNGVYEMVNSIMQLTNYEDERVKMGMNARTLAMKRHNRDIIITKLLEAYSSIILK